LRRVVWQKFTDVSEVLAASILRVIALKMEEASISETSSDYMAQHPRRQPSSYSPL
jgi:hypothetical protein